MRPGLRAVPFLWGALSIVVVFTVIYLVFVRSYIGQLIDEKAFTGADTWRGPFVDIARSLLDVLPVTAVVIGALIALAIVVVRRNWLVFAVAVGTAIAANVSTQVLKYTILSRPEKGVDVGLANSLPSGHTTVAASAALVVFLVASPRLRPLAAVLGSIATVAAGASTLVEQWHRPSDVIAGMLVVGFWGCLAGMVLSGLRVPGATPPVRAKLRPLFWIGGVCAAVALVALVVTYFSAQSGSSHLLVAYVGGVAAILATGFMLAPLGNRLYRDLG